MNKHVETLRELRADHADGAPYAAALDAAISALSAQTEAVVEAERRSVRGVVCRRRAYPCRGWQS